MASSAEVTEVNEYSTVKKFASLSDAQFNALITERESNNTRKGTDSAVRTIRAYLVENSLDRGFESWAADQLDTILWKYFTEARSAKGELYKKPHLSALDMG